MALAPPPVYRSTKKLPPKILDSINIYINRQDCVPRMSLASVAKLVAILRAVDKLKLTPYEQLQVLAEVSDQKVIK